MLGQVNVSLPSWDERSCFSSRLELKMCLIFSPSVLTPTAIKILGIVKIDCSTLIHWMKMMALASNDGKSFRGQDDICYIIISQF